MVVAVNDEREAALKGLGEDLPVLMDPSGVVAKAYGISGIPSVVLIDERGRIANVSVGLTRSGELEGMVNGLLNQG